MPAPAKAGRYELREEIGRGAMGVVYRAHDPMIGRDVAVKTLRLSEAGTGMSREELISRFQIEARAAGLLHHPNIVVVYDAGEEDGLFYITMELVEGRSLQALLDGHQLFPLPRVMHLMEQACAAIDFAHQHNVVHRDIKPANLMLTADDTLKMTDFGTAKILQFGTAQTQHVMGTPSYMSPEQVKGKPVDGRSDIFSLGVILYELMTGEKPFPGQNITTVIYKIINEDPIPPRSLDSSIHEGVSAVITRALAKEPATRFQSCHEMLQALKNYRNSLETESAPRRPTHAPARSHVQERRVPAPQTEEPLIEVELDDALPNAAQELPPQAQGKQADRKRNDLLVALILLAVIGFTGYRIWPAMREFWNGLHTPPEIPALPASPASASPASPAAQETAPAAQPNTLNAPLSAAPAPARAASASEPPASSDADGIKPSANATEQNAAPAQ